MVPKDGGDEIQVMKNRGVLRTPGKRTHIPPISGSSENPRLKSTFFLGGIKKYLGNGKSSTEKKSTNKKGRC